MLAGFIVSRADLSGDAMLKQYHHQKRTQTHAHTPLPYPKWINKLQLSRMKDDSDDQPKRNQEVSCFCGICGKLRRATVTRVNYTIILLLVTVLSFALSVPRMRSKINAIPHFCNEMVDSKTCDSLVGYTAVYRVCFGTAIFYLVLACVVVGVKNIEEVRARIHNGFWYIKFLLLIC